MPGGQRGLELQVVGHAGHDLRPQCVHLGQRADRAAQLKAERIGGSRLQALPAAHQGCGPAHALQTKAGDRGRLQQCARQHRVCGMAFGQQQQGLDGDLKISLHQRQRVTRDQRHRRVNHVLAGAAKVDKRHGLRIEKPHRFLQAFDQRNGNAAGTPAFTNDLVHVKQLDLAAADDGLCGGLGNQACTGLSAGQRPLKAQHGSQKMALAKRVQNLRCR